jgi:hypothetical protein
VNVVGHHNPGEHIIETPGCFPVTQRLDKHRGDARIFEPMGPQRSSVQLPAFPRECHTGMGVVKQELGSGLRQRAGEAPGNKYSGVLRDPMRESSLPEHVAPAILCVPQMG